MRSPPLPDQARAAGTAGGELTTARCEVVAGFRHSIPARGTLSRLPRFQGEPDKVDEAITSMREGSVPWDKGADGPCSFQLRFESRQWPSVIRTSARLDRDELGDSGPVAVTRYRHPVLCPVHAIVRSRRADVP